MYARPFYIDKFLSLETNKYLLDVVLQKIDKQDKIYVFHTDVILLVGA